MEICLFISLIFIHYCNIEPFSRLYIYMLTYSLHYSQRHTQPHTLHKYRQVYTPTKTYCKRGFINLWLSARFSMVKQCAWECTEA